MDKVRVQLLDEKTGAVLKEVDVLTAPDAVIFNDGKTLLDKINDGTFKGATGPQGIQGPAGEPFTIAKTYSSISAMNAGYATDGVKQGQFALIDTGNINDVDNAKLYYKGAAAYTFLTDLSGATGIQGAQGVQGIQGVKGDKGDTGATGSTGAQGATGQRGTEWFTGTAITGTSTTETIFSGSGITSALVNDQYFNISTGNVYKCTVAGNAATAKWIYTICLKGATGATGPQGIQGVTGATGPQGPKGDTGADGASIKVGTDYATGTDVKLFLKII